MAKVLFSWVATHTDFIEDQLEINVEKSPNHRIHELIEQNKDYDKHILLSTDASYQESPLGLRLENHLLQTFRHDVACHYTGLGQKNVNNIEAITRVIIEAMRPYEKDDIWAFVATGSTAMRLAWLVAYSDPTVNFRMVLLPPPMRKFTDKTARLQEVKVTKSKHAPAVYLRQKNIEESGNKNFHRIGNQIITKSIQEVYDDAECMARYPIDMVIYGKTGTGKEHLANYIHEQSGRKGDFFPVNCSTFSGGTIIARLFGYKEGAFTGATKDTKGILEEADGGTVFLDEIGNTSLEFQGMLLRFLEDKKVYRIQDEANPIPVDVKIIGAFNQDLEQLAEEGKFRGDLFYRFAHEFYLPALSEYTTTDRKTMITEFTKDIQKTLDLPKYSFSAELSKFLTTYNFAGNNRQLHHTIQTILLQHHRQATDAKSKIPITALPKRLLIPKPTNSFRLEDIEREHIIKVLTHFRGNQSETAKALGCVINTLKKKLSEYEINPLDYKR